MLETIAVILVILWLLGFVTSYTMGGLYKERHLIECFLPQG